MQKPTLLDSCTETIFAVVLNPVTPVTPDITTTSSTLNGLPIPSGSVITVAAPFVIPAIPIELTLPKFKVAEVFAGT